MSDNNQPAGFVQARQKAWDQYAESRAKQGQPILQGGPRSLGFNEGFTQGCAYGMKVNGYREAAGSPPLSRNGEAPPAITAQQAGKLADLIVYDLRVCGPGTAATIAQRIGHPLNTVSPRMRGLLDKGLIRVSGGAKVGRGNRTIYATNDPAIL